MNHADIPAAVEVTGVDAIVNPDRINHMPCRPRQLLAYAGARSPWADLLKYAALDRTSEFYRHIAVLGRNRWSYRPAYARETDLTALGFQLTHFGKLELPHVAQAREVLRSDRVLMFYAPGSDFAHYTAFLRELGTFDAYARDHHNFTVAGMSADGRELLIVDNANLAHEFGRVTVGLDTLERGWTADPENWFVDTLAIGLAGPPDLPELARRYRAAAARLDEDRFEIYDLIGQRLPAEVVPEPDLDHTPSLAMLRMLAGSRTLFHEFLRRTDHDPRVKAAYHQLARHLTQLIERTARYIGGRRDVRVDELRRDLHALRMREGKAAGLLRADLARIPLTFTPSPAPTEQARTS